MVQSPKTSFIPKNAPGSTPSRAPQRRGKKINILGVIGIVIFLGGLLAAGGVFFYERLSEEKLAVAKAELVDMKSSFRQSDIDRVLELKRRMDAAERLLERHLSPSIVFEMLEERTQSDVQFEGFSYSRNESGSVFLTLDGRTFIFNTIALQDDELRNTPVLDDVIFSNIGIDVANEEGGVDTIVFKVTSRANGEAIAYRVAPVVEDTTEDVGEEGGVPEGFGEEESDSSLEEEVSEEDTATSEEGDVSNEENI